jgi:hypothetical protein
VKLLRPHFRGEGGLATWVPGGETVRLEVGEPIGKHMVPVDEHGNELPEIKAMSVKERGEHLASSLIEVAEREAAEIRARALRDAADITGREEAPAKNTQAVVEGDKVNTNVEAEELHRSELVSDLEAAEAERDRREAAREFDHDGDGKPGGAPKGGNKKKD